MKRKQLLTLIRELSFYVAVAPDTQMVAPLLIAAQGYTDSDVDHKIFRLCLYLITTILLLNECEQDRSSPTLSEAITFVRRELEHSSGSKACILWRTFGTLVPIAKEDPPFSHITDSVTKLKSTLKGQKQKVTDTELKMWIAQLSSLYRIVTKNPLKNPIAKTEEIGGTITGELRGIEREREGYGRELILPQGCIDTIFAAVGSKNILLSQQGSSLLLLLSSALKNNSTNEIESKNTNIIDKNINQNIDNNIDNNGNKSMSKNFIENNNENESGCKYSPVTVRSSALRGSDKILIAKDLLKLFQVSQSDQYNNESVSTLNLNDPLTCSRILESIAILTECSELENIPRNILVQLNICSINLSSHPR